MNLDDALAKTATDKGPQSNLDRLLDAVNDDQRAQIVAKLESDIGLNHMQRALTLLARHHGVISGDRASVSAESIKKWRRR